tara:strand:+ start:293 stop:487 length:195 start_codon:yes stop_codon:yes gene_type:complete
MATDLRTRTKDYYMTRFSGGDNGPCVQVGVDSNYISLTREQAKKLSRDLAQFARGLEEEDHFAF